jgi:anti-sigma B factor antagonist
MQFLFKGRVHLMPTMHEAEGQAGDRRRRAAPERSDVSLTVEQPHSPQCTAGTLSVALLAAPEHRQNVAVLSVCGEIDLGTAPVLWEALLPVLECETGPVVVDLSEVSFMDSTGVHVLVDTLRRLEPESRPLAIVCREGGQVHRVLALLGLLDALTVHRSRESAVIGGGDVLRAEPGRNSRPLGARALTQSLPSARQTTEC